MIPYYERLDIDHTGITVEYGDSLRDIRYLEEGGTVAVHQHDFYEILVVRRGCCQHYFRNKWIPLIPGDIIILGIEDAHGIRFSEESSFNNIQFTPGIAAKLSLQDKIQELTRTTIKEQARPYLRRVRESMDLWGEETGTPLQEDLVDLNHQGILHLRPQEFREVTAMLDVMLDEQRNRLQDHCRIKELLLEILIIRLKRVKDLQIDSSRRAPDWQTELIQEVMAYVEANLENEFDFARVSEDHHLSLSHFRKLFKEVSGMSPVEYVNRVRILRSLELLQTTKKPIAEISDAVGIHDQNYFARLFKKMIGCPPSYFKAI